MILEVTGSLCEQCAQRLNNLHIQSHIWLLKHSQKLTRNREEAEDLVQDLYEYLHKKCNPKIFWGNAYHMYYLYRFLQSRWINKTKKLNRIVLETPPEEGEDIPYDVEWDNHLNKAHQAVLDELNRLSGTKMWAPAKIFELYWMSDKTLDEVANDINISKSTVFLSVKKIRKYLHGVLDNPFDTE